MKGCRVARFEGKVALVTGAAHGIGRACATRLSAEGAAVVIADIDQPAADEVVAELTESGGSAVAITCDVTSREAVDAAMQLVLDRYGRLDVLVNDVGVAGPESFTELDEGAWNRQVDPTLNGAIRCMQAALPLLLEAPGGGAVVSIASVNGMAAVGEVAYSAAKAGLISATRNLAVDYGPRAQGTVGRDRGWVRFNTVSPGTIATRVWTQNDDQRESLERLKDFYPMGRVGQPDDIASAVAFLASSDASWITGVNLPVDGGFLLAPYSLFKR
jgi:NAD(P)-dependent dehydrogenase (short-subunit alcohol dehydrogenase family)